MASSKDYLDFILDQLSELDDITYRAMMREYIIYYCDHAHVINEGKHGHTHTVEELEIALGHRGAL